MEKETSLSIFVFDHNPIHTARFEETIDVNSSARMVVCESVEEAGKWSSAPGLILINMEQGGRCSGLLLLHVLSEFPDARVLSYSSEIYAEWGALRTYGNRMAHLPLGDVVQSLRSCVTAILSGDSDHGIPPLAPADKNGEDRLMQLVNRFSPKEYEVFCLLGKGHGNPEIADILGCSLETVKSHLQGIRRKNKHSGIMGLRYLAIQYAQTGRCRVFSQCDDHICPCIDESVSNCPLRAYLDVEP